MSSHSSFNLKEAIERAKSGIKTRDSGEFAKISYLRDGKHKLRILRDPNGEIFRYVMVHQMAGTGKKCVCPNYLKEIDIKKYKDLESCEICKLAEESGQWRLNRRYQVLMYAYLYDTNSSDEYWKPGNPYLVIGRTKMRDSVLAFLEGLLEDASDFVNSMLDPHSSGGVVSVDVVSGAQGYVSITAIPNMLNKPPIDTEGWYRPLADSYISTSFDEVAYLEVLSLAKDKVAAAAATEQQAATSGTPSESLTPAPISVPTTPSTSEPGLAPIPDSTPVKDPPLTPENISQSAPTITEPDSGSTSTQNTVFTKTRRTITLPGNVVERQCWTKFNQSDPICGSCPIQLDCLYEQSNSKVQK